MALQDTAQPYKTEQERRSQAAVFRLTTTIILTYIELIQNQANKLGAVSVRTSYLY